MESEKKVLKRSECDKRYQWHIEDLYASDELWEKDYEDLERRIPELSAYEGRLKEGVRTFLSYEKKKRSFSKNLRQSMYMPIRNIMKIREMRFIRHSVPELRTCPC